MKFVVDECSAPSVARLMISLGFDVYSVSDQSPGWTDEEVLQKANQEDRIIITNDKDFGEQKIASLWSNFNAFRRRKNLK